MTFFQQFSDNAGSGPVNLAISFSHVVFSTQFFCYLHSHGFYRKFTVAVDAVKKTTELCIVATQNGNIHRTRLCTVDICAFCTYPTNLSHLHKVYGLFWGGGENVKVFEIGAKFFGVVFHRAM